VQHRLRIGTFRGDGDTKYRNVWAHVHGQYASHDQEKRNNISYFHSVGVKLEPQDVKKVTFAQPFQYIKNLNTDHGQEKLRFLILFYFLGGGYLESVEFTADGFSYFRRAVLDIAKDRKVAGAAPVRTKSANSSQKIIPKPAPSCPRTELLKLSEISHRAIHRSLQEIPALCPLKTQFLHKRGKDQLKNVRTMRAPRVSIHDIPKTLLKSAHHLQEG
jgi:hypothetical protein